MDAKKKKQLNKNIRDINKHYNSFDRFFMTPEEEEFHEMARHDEINAVRKKYEEDEN